MTPIASPDGHLDSHEVATYLTGAADPATRSRIEAHLADCEDCTAELVAVRRLHRPAAPTGGRIALGAAAAAVIAMVLVGPRLGGRHAHEPPPLRGDSAADAVAAIAPPDGATLSGTPTLVWRSLRDATAFRVAVTSETGDSIWAAVVADTSVTPPAGVLAKAGLYYWYVDALRSDGSSVPGTAHEFRLGP
jgi:anti-sigma factor RsiW